jgi:indolepyruvate ferredoxin oxidoreductase
VKVLIADKECAITLHRRLSSEKKKVLTQQGYLPREEKINITPEVCEYCLECTRQTGCPGLTVVETPYGRKISTDLSTCVDDGACARTKACPSFEKVVITRTAPPSKRDQKKFDFTELPDPVWNMNDGRWSAYTAGVGGMGAGIVNAVLVRAGMRAGYDVSFLDKKGLAIRNGGVYGHVVFSKEGPVASPVIPYAKADILIGLDLLESARALDARTNLRVAHPARTHAVINNHKHETVLSLMGRQDFDPIKLEKVIQSKIRLGGYVSADFSKLSEEHIGSKLYANMMIMGAAYQKGWIPLTPEQIFGAIDESVRKADVEANHFAFNLGRYFAFHPDMTRPAYQHQSVLDVLEEKAAYLKKSSVLFGGRLALSYRELIQQSLRWMDLPSESAVLLARTLYDLIRYENVDYARHYLTRVWNTYRRDNKDFGYRATQAVISNLFRVQAIKDEVWVAELLTSPEKYARDRERFHIDETQGDKIRYIHLNRPRFEVAGRTFEFNLNSKDWMLRLMKHAKFLRRLLPQWHRKEKAFRDWYVGLVDDFTYFSSSEDYENYLKALKTVEKVRGYREIRYPLMEKASEEARLAISQIKGRPPMASREGKNVHN